MCPGHCSALFIIVHHCSPHPHSAATFIASLLSYSAHCSFRYPPFTHRVSSQKIYTLSLQNRLQFAEANIYMFPP